MSLQRRVSGYLRYDSKFFFICCWLTRVSEASYRLFQARDRSLNHRPSNYQGSRALAISPTHFVFDHDIITLGRRFYAVSVRYSMGYRQLFFPPQTANMDSTDIWNHPFPDPHLHPGTAAIGVHPVPYFDIMLRSNNYPSSNFSLEIPNHNRRANPGALHDPFLHPASASSSNQMPSNYTQGGPSCYDGFAINSHMDYESAPFKRKNPAIPMAFDRGNGNCYHIAGSSSSFSVSSVNSQANPTSGPQYWAWDLNSMSQSYRNNNLITVGEGCQRNVRSRQSLALHLGNNQNEVRPPSSILHHLHPTSNISGLTAAGQWGHSPHLGYHRRILPPGTGSFNLGVNQSHAGSNSTTSSMEIDGRYHHNPVRNRIIGAPLATYNGPSSQVMSVGHGSYDQRTHSYRGVSSYQPPIGDGRQPVIEVVPPQHSRPLSIIDWTSERNGRSSGLYERFQPFSNGNNAHGGWVSEGGTFYGSRNLFDQHRDMRLDIDSMSYEELLDLEERIGNVSRGLSGDAISRYMVETTYCSPNQIQDDQEENNCVICLVVYKDKETVGRLNCGHNFHSNCIKKWLSIKNACPICKASALPDTSEER